MIKKQLEKTTPRTHKSVYPFFEHIAEFRRRLIVIVVAIAAASIVSYFYIEDILNFLLRPIDASQLYYSSPLGAVNFIFEICFIVGIIISSPIWLYQIWSFLKPAVPDEWQKRFWWWVALSSLLALVGASYGYFISLPATLSISEYFQSDHLSPLLSANEYLTFVSRYILAFTTFFQIPLIVFFASLIGVINSKILIKHQRHAIVASCVVGAVFTPTPDMINQFLLAAPLFILFELSLIGVLLKEKNGSLLTTTRHTK